MKLSDLSDRELSIRLCGAGLLLCSGPFKFRICASMASVSSGLRLLYADHVLAEVGEFVDFTVKLESGSGLRRWVRPQVSFCFNGGHPLVPLPIAQAFPLLEWSMNWCISTQVNHFLLLHAAVIERDGCAVIMPAPPGSGKSTLCAGLVNRGWRLLSDELALISLSDHLLSPLARPISLKNESIDVLRRFAPDAVFNLSTPGTSKGTVTHMKVPTEHLARMHERAKARWLIFPKYVAQAPTELKPRSRANSMLELARNSFNYMVLGLSGFETLGDVLDDCDCYDFRYSQLDDAVAAFDALAKAAAQ
jgi:HprK-related kinase A